MGSVAYYMYITGMVISAVTVPADQNPTDRIDPGMNTNIKTEYVKNQIHMFVFSLETFHFSSLTLHLAVNVC